MLRLTVSVANFSPSIRSPNTRCLQGQTKFASARPAADDRSGFGHGIQRTIARRFHTPESVPTGERWAQNLRGRATLPLRHDVRAGRDDHRLRRRCNPTKQFCCDSMMSAAYTTRLPAGGQFAFVRFFQPREDTEQSRFPRAVGSDQADAFALFDAESDPREEQPRAIPFGEISAGEQHRPRG